jgi:glycerol-3-phosphate dehydrogenase (NAD(P)+)
MIFNHIGVLGAGAWGTALAIVAARAGRTVTLWARDPAVAAQITARRENPRLHGVPIDEKIAITDDVAVATRADALLLAVPAQALRAVANAIAPVLARETPVVACAKGIESGSKKFMTEVIGECAALASPTILSGPSFAEDVARGLPTAVTLAASDEKLAASLAGSLGSTTFRPYHSSDMRGVEIGGAAKNVLAIAAGIVVGRALGASATAALVTRGFAELFRFGKALGARPETLVGLSGLGDLILTCSSHQSRNFSFGIALGQGRGVDDARQAFKLVEGFATAPVLVELAKEAGIEMPIANAVAAVLAGHIAVDKAIESLLARPLRAE